MAWILRWGPAVLVMAIIFAASATPGSDLPAFGAWDLVFKKGGHMLGYALLSIAYFHALNHGRLSRRLVFPAFFLACLYAAFDEWHQRFTPGRTPALGDILIDATGAAIGLALWCWLRSKSRARDTCTKSPAE